MLLGLQLIYSFIMGFAHMGYDGLHSVIPSTPHVRSTPTRWWSGYSPDSWAPYFIIPDEAGRELLGETRIHPTDQPDPCPGSWP